MKCEEDDDVWDEWSFKIKDVRGGRYLGRIMFEVEDVFEEEEEWGGRCLGFAERDFWKEKCVLGVRYYINGKGCK
jgi:hypothetical protein